LLSSRHMGCGCSTESTAPDLPSRETAATGTAAISTIAGGAVIGAVVAGPAAPIGAFVGAAVGLLVAKATANTVGKVLTVPVDVLDEMWRRLLMRPEILEQLPDIGQLRSERDFYPPAMEDLSSTNSYLYSTVPATVAGLPYAQALEAGPLTAAQLDALAEAVASLEAQKVVAITGDSGAMLHYQQEVTKMTTLPVVLSSLLQAPLLASVFAADEQVLVMTSDATVTTAAKLAEHLTACGVPAADVSRFVLVGCEEVEGFSKGGDRKLVPQLAADQLLGLARQQLAAHPNLRGVLLESTMLPMFADVLRKELALPVFDSTTLVDLVHKGKTDNPRFGVARFDQSNIDVRFKPEEMPAIGIMRIDYTYPPAMGDAANPNSYYYRTPHAVVTGLSFEDAQRGSPLTAAQRGAMEAAIAALEKVPDMMGIAGDCGFLINYQAEAVAMSKKAPVFISAMLQCPLLAALYAKGEEVLVLTANGPALEAVLPQLLTACHVRQEDQSRFSVAGCEALPGFEAVANAEKVDVAKVQPHVVDLVKQRKAQSPSIRAVLLECTELPPYADAIRAATGLLVLDVITLVDYFHSAVSENPYFGVDWEKLVNTPVKP